MAVKRIKTVKRTKTLKLIFSAFLLKTILGLVLSVLIPAFLFWFAASAGIVNYANSSELEVLSAAEALKKVEGVDTILHKLSGRIQYLVLDHASRVVQTTMTEEEVEAALQFFKVGESNLAKDVRYITVERADGIILLQYKIGTFFVNPKLDKLLPSPEIFLILCIISLAVFNSVFQIVCLERRMRRELSPIFEATNEFAKQNLDCEVGHSEIKEFEEVLLSFEHMKEELGNSLKRQWEIQQEQKEQIAALAHDFKTPMTVTIGNLDLLEETQLDGEQRTLLKSAFEALNRMSKYIQLLMEMTMASIRYEYCFQEFVVSNFLEQIKKQAKILCKKSQIHFHMEDDTKGETYVGDVQMLERAIMNLIQNAVEHTEKGKSVYFKIYVENSFLKLEIEDEGSGFSEKMLQYGTKLFAMDDVGRTAGTHYGMGLYFADSVIRRHGGEMLLDNSIEKKGAKIIVTFIKKF